MIKATIKKYGDEENGLILENLNTHKIIFSSYFDPCEPYVTPSEILDILDELGVEYELEIEDEEK